MINGEALPAAGPLYIALKVLPMGWTWSFYIVQAYTNSCSNNAVLILAVSRPEAGLRHLWEGALSLSLIATTFRCWATALKK